ncbi:MAG: hypothetical protein JEZ14_09050 [Marinilabiliaceae bacterium]|nr:hypothetical protein [Marinilabiliaceae bacterium]
MTRHCTGMTTLYSQMRQSLQEDDHSLQAIEVSLQMGDNSLQSKHLSLHESRTLSKTKGLHGQTF